MGCCNKVHEERPISRLRWWTGLGVMAASHGFVLCLLTLGAPFSARYRKVRRGWKVYSRDTLRSCWNQEGFRVGTAELATCDLAQRPAERPREVR